MIGTGTGMEMDTAKDMANHTGVVVREPSRIVMMGMGMAHSPGYIAGKRRHSEGRDGDVEVGMEMGMEMGIGMEMGMGMGWG